MDLEIRGKNEVCPLEHASIDVQLRHFFDNLQNAENVC
jgi:hypothetical protein